MSTSERPISDPDGPAGVASVDAGEVQLAPTEVAQLSVRSAAEALGAASTMSSKPPLPSQSKPPLPAVQQAQITDVSDEVEAASEPSHALVTNDASGSPKAGGAPRPSRRPSQPAEPSRPPPPPSGRKQSVPAMSAVPARVSERSVPVRRASLPPEAPASASAPPAMAPLLAMRIIAVGVSSSEESAASAPPEVEASLVEAEEPGAAEQEATEQEATEQEATEQSARDDGGLAFKASVDVTIEVEGRAAPQRAPAAEPQEDLEPEEADADGLLEEAPQAPPQPVRKAPPPLREEQRRRSGPPEPSRRRKPWWEELFSEEFLKAERFLAPKQLAAEVEFIESSLDLQRGATVLDLGCGSGQHAAALAARGYNVVAYDLSLDQLEIAAEVAQEQNQRLSLVQGDMRELSFNEAFDAIYCWNTTFGYFEEEKNLAVAQRLYAALKHGGRLVLDVVNRDFITSSLPSQVWYEGDHCVCMDDARLDFITGRMRIKRSVILDDGRTRECSYSLRVYGLHELGKLLHDVGFRITEVSGQTATRGKFFGESSPRIIILAERAEA